MCQWNQPVVLRRNQVSPLLLYRGPRGGRGSQAPLWWRCAAPPLIVTSHHLSAPSFPGSRARYGPSRVGESSALACRDAPIARIQATCVLLSASGVGVPESRDNQCFRVGVRDSRGVKFNGRGPWRGRGDGSRQRKKAQTGRARAAATGWGVGAGNDAVDDAASPLLPACPRRDKEPRSKIPSGRLPLLTMPRESKTKLSATKTVRPQWLFLFFFGVGFPGTAQRSDKPVQGWAGRSLMRRSYTSSSSTSTAAAQVRFAVGRAVRDCRDALELRHVGQGITGARPGRASRWADRAPAYARSGAWRCEAPS